MSLGKFILRVEAALLSNVGSCHNVGLKFGSYQTGQCQMHAAVPILWTL